MGDAVLEWIVAHHAFFNFFNLGYDDLKVRFPSCLSSSASAQLTGMLLVVI
jgi:hypothetical protein